MDRYSSRKQKYYRPLIGAALIAGSLFHFSLPVFAAGTAAGQVLRNTATGNYFDDGGNEYTIESNTVNVTVAKVAGITNQPAGIVDETTGGANTSVLTGDRISFEFEITNVGNDLTKIFIPELGTAVDPTIVTKGLSRATGSGDDKDNLVIQVSPALNADGTIAAGLPNAGTAFNFGNIPATGIAPNTRPGGGIIDNVPINGKVLVKVTGTVTATAAGAPIEVLLGNTGSDTEPNNPLADTQNQPDTDGSDAGGELNDIRTEEASDPASTQTLVGGEKEASALQQVFLGSNPLAMTRVEKTRVEPIDQGADPDLLNDNIITYNLELEVLNTTPNSLYTPGALEGRDFGGRITGAGINDSNLVLVSDAIPADTKLSEEITAVGNWIPVFTTDAGLPMAANWSSDFSSLTGNTAVAQTARDAVTRVGWVYDARPGADGAIATGTTFDSTSAGFTFKVITSGIDKDTGGTVANIAQAFGTTDDGDPDDGDPNTNDANSLGGTPVFDESGDQDPTNFNGATPGPDETATGSTGIADPSTHGVDSENNNNTNGADPASPGGEDNVITIGAPGALINGPSGQASATGNIFDVGPDNNHDFQNLGVDNFPDGAKHDAGTTFDPNVVVFNNTLSNPGSTDLENVLLQPINPEFEAGYSGTGATAITDDVLPTGTTVKITLGGQSATYTYLDNAATAGDTTDRLFRLTSGVAIRIPTLAAGVPLDYTVEVDLEEAGLSTDTAINGGFPVPIIAFQDNVTTDGTPNAGENRNLTVNQVYTGFIKVTKQVQVVKPDGNVRGTMDFNSTDPKEPLPGDTLEYRVIYRNISEAQVGTGNNTILNGVNVMLDENGTLADVTGAPANANNWALDSNNDGDLDTINVQGTADDTNSGTITFYTGATDVNLTPYSTKVDPPGGGLTSAGTVDPGDTVTGYRVTVPLLAPVGKEATAGLDTYNPGNGDSAFTFQRKVDGFDGLPEEGLEVGN